MTNGVQSSENPRWGNSRHAHIRQQRPVVVMGLPIVNTIEKLDPECPLKAGDTCRWETFSIGKGYTIAQGHLTGRASYTTASGLEVEVQQDTDGAWKGFKKPTALTFSPLRTITGSIAEPAQIDPVTHEIQGILAASERLCLPAPKVEAVVTCDLTALVKVYEARSTPALRTFKHGDLVTLRNDRIGEVHMLMHNGIYRVWIMGGTGLRFRAIEYYTIEELIALNPVVEQKQAA